MERLIAGPADNCAEIVLRDLQSGKPRRSRVPQERFFLSRPYRMYPRNDDSPFQPLPKEGLKQ